MSSSKPVVWSGCSLSYGHMYLGTLRLKTFGPPEWKVKHNQICKTCTNPIIAGMSTTTASTVTEVGPLPSTSDLLFIFVPKKINFFTAPKNLDWFQIKTPVSIKPIPLTTINVVLNCCDKYQIKKSKNGKPQGVPTRLILIFYEQSGR